MGGRSGGCDRPNVEYPADQMIEAQGTAIQSKVYSAPTKKRREMNQGGMNRILIARHEKKVTWNLMPEEKMVMEMAKKALFDKTDLSAYQIEQTPPSARKCSTAKA